MISDADLLAYIRPSTSDDLPTLRRLERAAVAMVQTRTGRYFGATTEVTATLQWRGWPMPLPNPPLDDALTTFESWDGSAWTSVDSSSFYYANGFVWLQSTGSWSPLTMPTRYRVTYDTGYESVGDDEWNAPEDIKQAVLIAVGHWFENREAVVVGATSTGELPLAFSYLIDGHIRAAV